MGFLGTARKVIDITDRLGGKEDDKGKDGDGAEKDKKGKVGDLIELKDKVEDRKGKVEALQGAMGNRKLFLSSFLAEHREKYVLSAEDTVADFLRRMLAENPEKLTLHYAEELLRLGPEVTDDDLRMFVSEVDLLTRGALRLRGALKKAKASSDFVRPLQYFVKNMKKLSKYVRNLAKLPDQERKDVLAGKTEKLTSGQKAVLAEKVKLEKMKSVLTPLAEKKAHEMRELDREVKAALDQVLQQDLAKRKGKDELASFNGAKVSAKVDDAKKTAAVSGVPEVVAEEKRAV